MARRLFRSRAATVAPTPAACRHPTRRPRLDAQDGRAPLHRRRFRPAVSSVGRASAVGSLPPAKRRRRGAEIEDCSIAHALEPSGPPPGDVGAGPLRLGVAYAYARSAGPRRQPRIRRAMKVKGGWAEHFGGCYRSIGRVAGVGGLRSPPVSSVRRAGAISARFCPNLRRSDRRRCGRRRVQRLGCRVGAGD
jgi:hypothetical protein